LRESAVVRLRWYALFQQRLEHQEIRTRKFYHAVTHAVPVAQVISLTIFARDREPAVADAEGRRGGDRRCGGHLLAQDRAVGHAYCHHGIKYERIGARQQHLNQSLTVVHAQVIILARPVDDLEDTRFCADRWRSLRFRISEQLADAQYGNEDLQWLHRLYHAVRI